MNLRNNLAIATASLLAFAGLAAPVRAEDVSMEDIQIIVQACMAIDSGEVTQDELDMLDGEEYDALMSACGFAGDGDVAEAEMEEFSGFYVAFQEDVSAILVVVEAETSGEGGSADAEDSTEEESEVADADDVEDAEMDESEDDVEDAEMDESEDDVEEAEMDESEDSEEGEEG